MKFLILRKQDLCISIATWNSTYRPISSEMFSLTCAKMEQTVLLLCYHELDRSRLYTICIVVLKLPMPARDQQGKWITYVITISIFLSLPIEKSIHLYDINILRIRPAFNWWIVTFVKTVLLWFNSLQLHLKFPSLSDEKIISYTQISFRMLNSTTHK